MTDFAPRHRYYNPVSFRTELPPPVSRFDAVETLVVRFVTDRARLRALVPAFFDLPEEALVSVAHSHNIGVDWLAGRTYYVSRVETPVLYRHEGEVLSGSFSLVIWESDAKPVILGRELQGYQKIVGNVPPHVLEGSGARFECREYDTLLFRGTLRDLAPVDEGTFQAARAQLDRTGQQSFGWKYIPRPQGGADLDYVTQLVFRGTLTGMWQGTGEIAFETPEWKDAPGCAHIMAALSGLPILEYRPAAMTRWRHVTLPRDEVRRLS